LPWDDDVPDEGRPAEEVLGQVLQRGRQLRRRHRLAVRATGAIAVVTCMLGVVAAVSVAGPGPARVVRAAGTPTTSPSVPETTTEAPTSAVSQTTTTSAVVPAHKPTTTSSTLVCHNSSDPRCGPFRWDPDPGPNQPLTVQVTFSPEHPHAGEPVTFHVIASDPDAKIIGHGLEFSDAPRPMLAPAATCEFNRFGPWTPPPAAPDRETFEETHTYASPGTYSVTAYAWSANPLPGDTCHDPYGSGGEPWKVTVIVQ
jgi:hypothetical protein